MKSPLPWKFEHNEMELKIIDANGNPVIFGNVNRGIEYDDPAVVVILEMAIEWINELNHE